MDWDWVKNIEGLTGAWADQDMPEVHHCIQFAAVVAAIEGHV